jgi:S-formylglutathione hydrolase FrmB
MVRTHTVAARETLSALALRFYGDAELYRLIATASGVADPNVIHPGQRLIMPDFTRYTVATGDTLSGLAQRFYGDASLHPLIATVNGIPNPNSINVGRVLVIFVGRGDGFGLTIVDRNENDPRLKYYRFQTSAIGWNPGVNVLLPDDYATSGRRYPVLYMFHGGNDDFRQFDFLGIRDLTAGKPIIVVMPDGGHAGWYSNPVSSFVGPRNWETFHIAQLLPWIEANFRTFAEYDGRAVSGFSMGGFGALKYAAKYYGHFASVSAHSGPASLRRDFGLVVHWANITSAVLDLGGGTVYGAPNWDQARVSADNPVERIESYRNKRIFLVAGTSPDPLNWFDSVNETQVLAGQREFRERLSEAGIPHESHEVPGGHVFRSDMFVRDLDGIIARLRHASSAASGSAPDAGE